MLSVTIVLDMQESPAHTCVLTYRQAHMCTAHAITQTYIYTHQGNTNSVFLRDQMVDTMVELFHKLS